MSTRIKKLLHLKPEGEAREDGSSRRSSGRQSLDRSSPGIPTSPYNTVAPGSPPKTGNTPVHGRSFDEVRAGRLSSERQYTPRHQRGQSGSRHGASSLAAEPYAPNPHTLSTISTGPELSAGLEHLTLGGDPRSIEPPRQRYNEDVANRHLGEGSLGYQHEPNYSAFVPERTLGEEQHPAHRRQTFAEHQAARTKPLPAVPGQSRFEQPSAYDHGAQSYGSRSTEPNFSTSVNEMNSQSSASEWPLPPAPLNPRQGRENLAHEAARDQVEVPSRAPPQPPAPEGYIPLAEQRHPGEQEYLIRSAVATPALEKIVDLSNTEDTTVHTKIAPPVIHETVQPEVHNIIHEETTREIHNYSVYHRILPIIDVQVLPARHYVAADEVHAFGARPLDPVRVPTSEPSTKAVGITPNSRRRIEIGNDATLVEVDGRSLPGRVSPGGTYRTPGDTDYAKHWAIVEMVSQMKPTNHVHQGPRNFTARTFEGREGEFREWVGEDGIRRSERTWIHAPSYDEGARLTGQTVGLDMRPGGGFVSEAEAQAIERGRVSEITQAGKDQLTFFGNPARTRTPMGVPGGFPPTP